MRPVLSIMLVLGAAVTHTAMSATGPAHADVPVDAETSSDFNSGTVILQTGSPGSGGGGSAAPVSTGGGGGGMCSFNGASIPCTKDGGWWSASYGCYISGPIAIFNTANTGGEGFGFYECELPGGGVSILRLPDTAPPIQVDPEVLARRAIEQMGLQAIDIGIVPEPGPASVGLVGLPVWLWVDQPGAATYGPVSASATDGTTTVTATAQVTELVWDMGDGATVTCTTPGTPYADRYGDSMSPDCGHRYTRTSADQPGQVYQVTATSQWEVDWSGGGASGVIPITLNSSTPVRVGEAQVLVQ